MDGPPPLTDDDYQERSPAPNGKPTRTREVTPLVPLAAEAAIEEWSRPLPPAVPTGIEPVDTGLGGGLRPEAAYVIVGKAGEGKSGLACQISRGLARRQTVVYCSTELGARQVIARLAAGVLGVPWLGLYEDDTAGPRIAEALRDTRIRVLALEPSHDMFAAVARVAEAEAAPPAIVLDYLQDYSRRRGAPEDDRRLAVAALSDDIRAWCRAAKSTAILVSSTSRAHYTADGRSPGECLAAAKEAGDVEQDAAAVMCMHRDPPDEHGDIRIRLTLAKHRFGPAGDVSIGLRYLGARGIYVADESAIMTPIERDAYAAIVDGATSVDAVRQKLEVGKPKAQAAIERLVLMGLIDRHPLRARHP